ncbi:hypothetical protein O181_030672 [Austropuccinia psidii MF-1]|uniref:Uncharacterized protein n=1 Tax=Austropuccinia psidii MF-1 TaxID=1389203 RepID=A0A9Q3CW69_9BASI|nr:hypothetical protein [Austropuccinia psidii MF-1]
MSPVHLRNLEISRNRPEDRPGLIRVRRTGSGHHGSHDIWQDTLGNHTHTAINPPIQCNFKEKRRIKRKQQDFFQPKEEIVRPNDTEAVGLGERSTQEPEVVVNTSNRIICPATKNITPTEMEHSVVTPESNINSNELWLKMSSFQNQRQENFGKVQENNVRLEEFKASQKEIVKTLQERNSKLLKASEETNKILNQVLEE